MRKPSMRTKSLKLKLAQELDYLRFIARRFSEEQCLQVAGSLTFTSLLALVPLATIALTVASAFPTFADVSTRFKIMLLSNLVPDFAGKVITVYMRQFSENAARLTALGIVFLGATAIMTIFTVDRAFNRIWRVRRQEGLFVRRLLVYWALLTIAPLLIGGSLSLSSWIWTLSRPLLRGSEWQEAWLLVLKVIPTLFAWFAFTLIYQLVPRCYVPARHALIAGGLAAIAFLATHQVFGLFIKYFNTYKLVYGAFASLPVFLIWLYLIWIIVLGGAVLCAAFGYWRDAAWQRPDEAGQRFVIAVQLLVLLENAHQSGARIRTEDLRYRLQIGWDELYSTLEDLRAAGLAQKSTSGGWLLGRAAERIYLTELFHLLVWPQAKLHQSNLALKEVERLLTPHRQRIEVDLNVSLAEFANRLRQPAAAVEITQGL